MECSGILNGYTIWYAMGCNGIQSPEVTLGWCIAGLIINFGLWYFKKGLSKQPSTILLRYHYHTLLDICMCIYIYIIHIYINIYSFWHDIRFPNMWSPKIQCVLKTCFSFTCQFERPKFWDTPRNSFGNEEFSFEIWSIRIWPKLWVGVKSSGLDRKIRQSISKFHVWAVA